MTGFNRRNQWSSSRGDATLARGGSLRRLVMVAAVSSTVALLATPVVANALDASPPPDCNGNAGVLATPQNTNGGGTPFLTKALTNTVQGTGSTTYFYLVTTNRPSASTFTELLDCAYSTITGNPIVATYGSQQNNPTFSNGQLTIALTVNANDSICDRVQLKGTDPSAVPFIDYSNLVGAPTGTSCSPGPQVPEAPLAGLLLVTGGLSAAWFVHKRRGRRPFEPL